MIQMVSLSASMLMILYSQSNAWYAAKPEENLVQDIIRKLFLSLLLLMPNLAIFGVGVIFVLMSSWHTLTIVAYCFAGTFAIMIIGLCLNKNENKCIYCLCACFYCLRAICADAGCCRKSVLLLTFIYPSLFGLMVWLTAEANTNPEDYNHAIIITKGYFNPIADIIFGIGFLPVILMIIAIGFGILFCVCLPCSCVFIRQRKKKNERPDVLEDILDLILCNICCANKDLH